jgi:threonyl-tRNA synthetase
MSLPERFNLHFVDKDNERKRPIMIHRVIYGSIERFLGILVEHFAGRFPLWMAPVQAVLLPMNDDLAAYAEEVHARFVAAGLRAEVDSRTESLNRKVREAQLAQIPLTLTIGPKEREAGTLAVRTLDGQVAYGVSQERFVDAVNGNVRRRGLSFAGFGAEERQ